MAKPTSIRELRDSGYTSRSVKQELRDNLIARLRKGEGLFLDRGRLATAFLTQLLGLTALALLGLLLHAGTFALLLREGGALLLRAHTTHHYGRRAG